MKRALALLPLALAVVTSIIAAQRAPRLAELHDMTPSAHGRALYDFGLRAKLVDVDGDAIPEMILVDLRVSLWRQDGHAHFTQDPDAFPRAEDARSLAVGDLDGDLDADVFLGTGASESVLRNDGAGRFQAFTGAVAPSSDSTWDVELGDVDGDGDLDAVLATGSRGYVAGARGPNRLLFNDGSARFSEAVFPLDADNTTALDLVDVDADGDPDAVFGSLGPNALKLYRNSGGAFSVDGSAIPINPISFVQYVASGDMDGDGDVDLVSDGALSWNDGTGHFGAWQTVANLTDSYNGYFALADVDGDARLDVVTSDQEPGWIELAVFRNPASGSLRWLSSTVLDTRGWIQDIELDDLDGDGDVDGFVADVFRNHLVLGDGQGHFIDVQRSLPNHPFLYPGTAVVDVDNDGFLDVVNDSTLEDYVTHGLLWLNDRAGGFIDVSPRFPGGFSGRLTPADIDGDGDVDLFDTEGLLFLNNGLGTFRLTTGRLPVSTGYFRDIAAGDIDLDGAIDAVVANDGARNLLWNNQAGFFHDVPGTFTIVDDSYDVELGDLDGDGRTDVLFGNLGSNRVYRNTPGALVEIPGSLPKTDLTRKITLGDVDRDGDLDAFLVSDPRVRLGLNAGNGTFFDAPLSRLPHELETGSDAHFVDIDDDGDLDLLIAAGLPQYQESLPGPRYRQADAPPLGDALLLNDGYGFFTRDRGLPPGISLELVPADFDKDGDIDVLLDNSTLWSNLTRHLAWRSLPRIGHPVELELFGSIASPWTLYGSLYSTYQPLPPYGILRFDLAGLVSVTSGTLDSQGRATKAFSIPASPGLIGTTLYFQALLGSPPRFTCLEVVTLSGF